MFEFINANWGWILPLLLVVIKAVSNKIPTEKRVKIFSWLDDITDALSPDKKKGGGEHKKK